MNKILFFGNERLATGASTTAPVLQALIAAGYEITGVVVAQNESSQSRNARELEIVQVAKHHDIPVLSPANLHDATDEIAALEAEVGVLVAYGKIVPQSIIDLFPRGIINIHPSLLPKHRGPTPIESVILQGDKETGVSLMQLSAGMDAGPVYIQTVIPLTGKETKPELVEQLLKAGTDLLLANIEDILDGSRQPVAQDDTEATYDQLITKDNSQLEWQKPAEQLAREVRAYLGWPRSRTTIGSTEVIITIAHATKGQGEPGNLRIEQKEVGLFTREGILIIDRLIPAGKKEMDAAAFLAGYQPS